MLDSLVRAGHQVTALVRDTNRGKHVAARGATPAVADLGDAAGWQDAAAAQDAWIHAAVEYTPRGPGSTGWPPRRRRSTRPRR